MDFSVNPEQEAVIDVARRFAIEHLAPGYRKREKQGRVERTLVADMGRLGLLGVELPKEFGARGAEYVTSGLVLEAIARGDFNVGYVNILVSLVGQIIARFAMPEIAREWLPEMIAGRKLPSLALTEPRGGSDAANIQLSAKRQDGAYVLTGEKVSIGLATQADLSIVFARTGAPEDGAKGVTAFLVPLDIPGLTRAVKERIGSRCVGGGSLSFDGVKVPAHYRLGEENKGFVQVMYGPSASTATNRISFSFRTRLSPRLRGRSSDACRLPAPNTPGASRRQAWRHTSAFCAETPCPSATLRRMPKRAGCSSRRSHSTPTMRGRIPCLPWRNIVSGDWIRRVPAMLWKGPSRRRRRQPHSTRTTASATTHSAGSTYSCGPSIWPSTTIARGTA